MTKAKTKTREARRLPRLATAQRLELADFTSAQLEQEALRRAIARADETILLTRIQLAQMVNKQAARWDELERQTARGQ